MRLVRTLPFAVIAVAGCSDSTGPGDGPRPVSGIVVLNASQNTGLTLRSINGADSSFLAFTPSSAFDGGSITVQGDTVLSTSSKAKGDQLWLATLGNGGLVRIQLPALSNPAGAAFVDRPEGRIAVALRDSQAVAIVRTTAGTPQVTMLRDAGTCPVDVAAHGSDVWVVDSRARCRTDYVVEGPARLIRIRASSTARDTVALPAAQRGSSAAVVVVGDVAYVATGGEADFSNWPNTVFTTPGMITRVDLATRQVGASRALPTGTYGAGLKVGANGRLYVTAYTATSFATQAVYSLDPQTLAFVGPFAAGSQALALAKSGGAAANCGAATADDDGNVYCLETDFGAAGATTVHVFGPGGAWLRSMQAGQYGADLVLR